MDTFDEKSSATKISRKCIFTGTVQWKLTGVECAISIDMSPFKGTVARDFLASVSLIMR